MMLDQSHDHKIIGHNSEEILLRAKEYPNLRNMALLEQAIRIFFTLVFFFPLFFTSYLLPDVFNM